MKKSFRVFSILLIISVTMFSLSACATYDAFMEANFHKEKVPEETVRFGVFEPLSGADKGYGELEKIGIELANELYPTCLKKRVELVYADNKSDIYVAETAIQELIAKRPAIVLGSYGSVNSLVAVSYLEKAKIPAIAITNENPLVTSNNPYYFRVCFVESYQGVALGKYAVQGLGATSAAIMRAKNDDTAVAMSQTFEAKMVQMTEDPSAVTSIIEYPSDTEDFTEYLETLKATGVKVVFLPTKASDAEKILKQAYSMGFNAKFLGTEEWETDDFIKKTGDAAKLAAISTIYDAESGINEMAEVFLKEYRAKYGDDKTPEPAVALGFDAYMIAINAIERIGTALDGELLCKSLHLTSKYPGASGNITLDENGDPMKSVVIKGVSDGHFVGIYTIEPILTY